MIRSLTYWKFEVASYPLTKSDDESSHNLTTI
nr:MAG TPA: hypothetical protein [Caudoviricetes sp.]